MSAVPPSASPSTLAAVASTNAKVPAKEASSAEVVTGLTPDQVLQELKKSGYVDQLRRAMFEAFTASAAAAVPAPALASAAKTPHASASASQPATCGADSTPSIAASPASVVTPTIASPASTSLTSPATSAPPNPTPTSATPFDVSSKATFLTTLAKPLRHHVETEHDSLRFLDARGQQDKLLKLLESEAVDHAQREQEGEGTLYDWLVRHIVIGNGKETEGTAGLIGKEGKVGKEVWGRVEDVIRETLNPGAAEKDDDDGEEEEEEGEGEDEANIEADRKDAVIGSAQQDGAHSETGTAQLASEGTSDKVATTDMEED